MYWQEATLKPSKTDFNKDSNEVPSSLDLAKTHKSSKKDTNEILPTKGIVTSAKDIELASNEGENK